MADEGKIIHCIYSGEKIHLSHLIWIYTVGTVEIIIRLSTRTDVGKI